MKSRLQSTQFTLVKSFVKKKKPWQQRFWGEAIEDSNLPPNMDSSCSIFFMTRSKLSRSHFLGNCWRWFFPFKPFIYIFHERTLQDTWRFESSRPPPPRRCSWGVTSTRIQRPCPVGSYGFAPSTISPRPLRRQQPSRRCRGAQQRRRRRPTHLLQLISARGDGSGCCCRRPMTHFQASFVSRKEP